MEMAFVTPIFSINCYLQNVFNFEVDSMMSIAITILVTFRTQLKGASGKEMSKIIQFRKVRFKHMTPSSMVEHPEMRHQQDSWILDVGSTSNTVKHWKLPFDGSGTV